MTNEKSGARRGRALKRKKPLHNAIFGARPRPLWLVIITDVLLTGLALVVFAYFHHVRPTMLENENRIIARPTAAVNAKPTEPAAEVSAQPTSQEDVLPGATATPDLRPAFTPEPDAEGVFANKFADKFTNGEVISSAENGIYTYQSANLNITTTTSTYDTGKGACVYYVTDFYVRDISCISTAFVKNKFASGIYAWLTDMSKAAGAIVAVNGDFCTMRKYGVVIRNGVMYRSKHSSLDACVIYWNGEMETFASKDWDAQSMLDKGAYQAWCFGPRLLDDDGGAMTEFNATSGINRRNPRTAIGYFEPGHYCFLTVDGRSDESRGLTLSQMSKLMSDLGCKAAYNLDGGQSSSLVWMNEVISVPYDGGRKIPDAVFLLDGTVG